MASGLRTLTWQRVLGLLAVLAAVAEHELVLAFALASELARELEPGPELALVPGPVRKTVSWAGIDRKDYSSLTVLPDEQYCTPAAALGAGCRQLHRGTLSSRIA